jgi:NitT/TauT family transport system ATP-binding protein
VSTADSVVSIRGLSKVFGKGGVTALEGIELEVERGEFVSLIGPSGCGKSTLLRIVGDIIGPTEGVVTVNGKPARKARLDRDYGIVFQAPVLYDWRTVVKNIALPLEMLGWERSKRAARIKEMVELVELSGFEKHHPWQLSGGMQQRVAIARGLAYDAPVLLMDEPFGSVDAQARFELEDLVLDLRRRLGISIIVVTHDIDEAVYLGDRVVVLNGRPATVVDNVDVDLGADRDQIATRALPRFAELRTRVLTRIRGGHVDAPAQQRNPVTTAA